MTVKTKVTTIFAIAVCHAATLSAQAPANARLDSLRLSREEAIAQALANNPQLDVAREQTAQARARKVQGSAIPDPALTFSYDNQPGFLKFGGAEKNAVVGLQVPFPNKFGLRNRIGAADVRSAEFSFEGLRQELAAETSTAYDQLLIAYRHREIFRTSRDLAQDFLKKTQARFEGGTAAKLDVTRAQVAVAQSENDLIGAERDIKNAANAMDRFIGRAMGTPIMPSDSLTVPQPLPSVDALELQALNTRPEIASLVAQQAGAKAVTSLAKQYWTPDLTVGAQRDYAALGGGTLYTAGIALPVPLFFWQHNKGEIAESQHREKELTAGMRDLRAQVSQDVRTAFENADAALKQAIYLRDALLPSAREAYRVASVSYGLGGSSSLDVLDARRALLDAETQFADALTAANSARADLERAAATSLARFDTRKNP